VAFCTRAFQIQMEYLSAMAAHFITTFTIAKLLIEEQSTFVQNLEEGSQHFSCHFRYQIY
jgi:hypothetical protein